MTAGIAPAGIHPFFLQRNVLPHTVRSGYRRQQVVLIMAQRGVGNAFMHSADGTDESVPYRMLHKQGEHQVLPFSYFTISTAQTILESPGCPMRWSAKR